MKSKRKASCSMTRALLLVTSLTAVTARPHVHGILENIRRLVHPPSTNVSYTHVPATFSLSVLMQPSDAVPPHPTAINAPLAEPSRANATISAPSQLPSVDSSPKPLELVLQDGRQTWFRGAHPKSQHHGLHHKHTTKVSTPLTTAALTLPISSTDPSDNLRIARRVQTVSSNPNQGAYQSWILGGFSNPSSASAPAAGSQPTSLCPANNGTVFRSSSGITYQTMCGIDYGDDIRPFLLVDSFDACIQKCDAYNYDNHAVRCVAALFIPSRISGEDDCYLKSSIAHPSAGMSIVEGAIRYSVAQSARLPVSATSSSLLSLLSSTTSAPSRASSSLPASLLSTTSASSRSSSTRSQTLSTTSPVTPVTVSQPGVTYGQGSLVIAPRVGGSKLHGPTENRPTSQYIQYGGAQGISLSRSLLRAGVNGDLSTGYDISPQTGGLEVNIYTENLLAPLRNTPRLSRDGGRGGYLNGQHLFMFCDTGTYSTANSASNGDFLDFVSSSVAVDVGMNALSGRPLHLQDGIGGWSDDVGRQRGFAPLTQGEQAYNIEMQSQGQRYAVWIESSLVPLDGETGIIYAPIVYDNVNMVTREPIFTYTGNTLLRVTAGGRGGPVARRPIRKLFEQGEPEWGVAGAYRSWGPSGVGGTDGRVYLFGGVSGGMLMARVAADSIEDRDAYEYWTGSSWTTIMPSTTSKAFFIEGPIMDIDIFFSPRHMTFIVVYLTIYADSTFYYRYLKAPNAIIPGYAPGGDKNSDYAENLLKYDWSEEQVLYKAQTGLGGSFIYSGGVHTRYFGSDDIVNGGSRMLLSWTAPTGQNPASAVTEYQIVTAEVNLV